MCRQPPGSTRTDPPFSLHDALPISLLQLPDSGGGVVAPLQDAPPAAGPFAELLAESLLRVGIPASTTAVVENAFLLEGRTTIAALHGDTADLVIQWRL